MISIKVHDSYRRVVAVCDSDLIGKKFFEGNRQLDLRENFYAGEIFDEAKTIEVLRRHALDDATFNIVGEKAVNAAIKSGLVEEDGYGEIGGIKFTLVLV